MQTIKLSEKNARDIYPSAAQPLKTILEDSFGKEFFSQKITDRVKTFSDACSVLGVNPDHLAFEGIPGELQKDEQSIRAYAMLILVARSLNEGWKPDWTNHSQYKYYPWFTMESGSGLAYNDCAYRCSGSGVGSRLCFKSRELAEYAGKQFRDLYNQYMNY
jgi:hypothetical protein